MFGSLAGMGLVDWNQGNILSIVYDEAMTGRRHQSSSDATPPRAFGDLNNGSHAVKKYSHLSPA